MLSLPDYSTSKNSEHAGKALPFAVEESDAPWLETHWGFDPGARWVAEAMRDALDGVLVCAEFSRLFVDPNRPVGHETWIRREVEGHVLDFNRDPNLADRHALWDAYHRAVDQTVASTLLGGCRPVLFSVHSFTPIYEGEQRSMEMGVLFDGYETLASELVNRLAGRGYHVAMNEPYSGFDGLVYSVERHGRAHRCPYLEIEVRQDLLTTEAAARAIGEEVATDWRFVAEGLIRAQEES